HLAVLAAPGRLVGVDAQAQNARLQLVTRGGALRGGPVRQIVRDPSTWVEARLGEGLVEVQLVAAAIERAGVVAIFWEHVAKHAASLSARNRASPGDPRSARAARASGWPGQRRPVKTPLTDGPSPGEYEVSDKHDKGRGVGSSLRR